MLDLLVFILVGATLGTFTGLVPGVHVNTVVIVVLSLLPFLLAHLPVQAVIAMIIAMSVVHTFVDYIPSILLGAPMEDSVLSVLPGHRMLMEGRGYEAIRLTVLGGVGASLLGGLILPFGLYLFPMLYSYARASMAYLLLSVLIYMVYTERGNRRRLYSLIVIAYSGLLGIIVLNHYILPQKYALFPALTGLFGVSTLLKSIGSKPRIPRQTLSYSKKMYLRGVAMGSLGGILTGLLPSMGSSQSALMIQNMMGRGERNVREFLVAIGGVNTADAIYALFALYLIGNPRSGASIAMEQIVGEFGFNDLILMVAVVLATTFFAASITLGLARFSVRRIESVDYHLYTKVILAFLFVLIVVLTGWRGLLIAVTATSIGTIAIYAGVKRTHGMALLMVPTILYFM
ncbi:MAG: tripartite tricarboxylate transporter permease [Candidatus Hydrothermarchaeaceae archaeon]